MLASQKTVIIIVGPTASGKTALSIKLARHLNTSIISADSRQCFKELNIGVAKPSVEELKSIKHYFINTHSIFENVTAQIFEEYALRALQEIFSESDYAVMVGGTGLYIKAFCDGLDEIPAADEQIRKNIIENYDSLGLKWLQDEVRRKDPIYWERGEQQNPRRLMRALEVISATGKSITDYQKDEKKQRPFRMVKIGLQLSSERLHQNIDRRTDKMLEDGLINEAESLLMHKRLNALQTVGYSEIFKYLDGEISLAEAVVQIKASTRHYAKRQLTWFRKDNEIVWKNADAFSLKDIINDCGL